MAAKEIADDHRVHLGLKKFEELQIMKFAWHNNIPDLAAWNSSVVEEVDLWEFEQLLSLENQAEQNDSESGAIFEVSSYMVVEL